jgi:NADH-quinone oxidoreductase subunit L
VLNLLWLVPALPLAGFAALVLGGKRLTPSMCALIGAGSVGLAALVALAVGVDFIGAPPPGNVFRQTLWNWIDVAGFAPRVGLYLDALALTMLLVVTLVGFLIHLYSTEYMRGDDGYGRFFAYMNLFVGAMCVLVLADNLLLLYLGWEGVGLCSYLLIGFWYREPDNGRAAQKAFIVTRVGDCAFLLGLLLLFAALGTPDIQLLMQRAALQWPGGSAWAVAAALLLLGGALGKSAQLPLQTWLPDAMAGPTPVSALIHAATMVTAGVYLIARTHVLFALAPPVQLLVAAIGALTLLLAGCAALVQRDIKRVLAYSTMSQIGYMFLALGVGAWSAAMFHFLTHACFKALLFMAAGAVILRLHHEQDIFKMGGLRREMPGVFWSFLIGAAALAALPLVTAGFYSKDQILWQVWVSPLGGPWLWAAGWLGALLTGLYAFRLVFVAFYGAPRDGLAGDGLGARPGPRIMAPLAVLSVLSVTAGWIELPPLLGDRPLFSDWLRGALPPAPIPASTDMHRLELPLALAAGAASLAGIGLAYLLYLRAPALPARLLASRPAAALRAFWQGGWGFDTLYDRILVRPYRWLARAWRADPLDAPYDGAAALSRLLYRGLSATQSGQLRHYAAAIAAGAVVVLFIAVAA